MKGWKKKEQSLAMNMQVFQVIFCFEKSGELHLHSVNSSPAAREADLFIVHFLIVTVCTIFRQSECVWLRDIERKQRDKDRVRER
jgi:hypothetical protein